MQPRPPAAPLRDRVGRVRSIPGLRRAGRLLARQLGLPQAPSIKVGYVPWKGPETPIIDCTAAFHGSFTVARWAVRGKYRRSWATLEYALVSSIGFWLESHRRDPMLAGKGTTEALLAWYGEEVGRPLADAEERSSRVTKRVLIGLGLLLGLYVVLWSIGVAR
jgi:hypothetical protein